MNRNFGSYLGGNKNHNFLDVHKGGSSTGPSGVNTQTPQVIVIDSQQTPHYQNTRDRGSIPIMQYGRMKINIKITRETNNIDDQIPFALWGPINTPDNYVSCFQASKTFVTGGDVEYTYDGGDGLITWTVAGDTDVIRIHSLGLTDYALLQEQIRGGGSLTSTGIRDITDETFYFNMFTAYDIYGVVNEFGSVQQEVSENIIVNQNPDNYLKGIIDIDIPIAIDNCRALVSGFPNYPLTPTVAKSYLWSFWNVDFVNGGTFSK